MTMLGVASLTASAMFFTLHAFAQTMPGVRAWAIGCLAVGFATLLDGPRLIDSWQLASLLFNIPFSVGQALFLVGTLQFLGRSYRASTLPLLIGIPVLLTVLFTYLVPDSVARIFTLSLYQTIVNVITAWLFLRYRDPAAYRPYLLASTVALVQAAAALAQAMLVALTPLAITYAAPELPFANIITWAGTTLNVIVGNWILFLLVVLRLVSHLNAVAANDALTGLLNRRGLRSHIDLILDTRPHTQSMSVLLLDIDHFKKINDEFGHEAGDKVLAMMGQFLRELTTTDVVPGRWGGEEFCVIVTNRQTVELHALAEALRLGFQEASLALPALVRGATVSIGVATSMLDDTFEFSKLVALADAQLYLAKEGGRNNVRVSSLEYHAPAAPEFAI